MRTITATVSGLADERAGHRYSWFVEYLKRTGAAEVIDPEFCSASLN